MSNGLFCKYTLMPVTVDEEDELRELDERGNTRTLQQLLAGDIPVLSTKPAKLRHGLRKRNIVVLYNMPPGDVGIYVMLPASRQGALVVETTQGIPAGMVVGVLEGIQAQQTRKDTRLTEAIQDYKQVDDKVAGEIAQQSTNSSTH